MASAETLCKHRCKIEPEAEPPLDADILDAIKNFDIRGLPPPGLKSGDQPHDIMDALTHLTVVAILTFIPS